MNTTSHESRPLGYWLRTADHLISRQFATALEGEGVSRRDWMLLNVIDGSVDAPGLADRLQRGGKRLRRLEDRGWITKTDEGWTLTDEGRTAKARLAEIVDGIRARVADAVSPDDYRTTIASLEAIARELGWDESMRMPFGPGRRFTRRGFGPRFGRRHGFGPDLVPPFAPGFHAEDGDEGHGPHGRGHGYGYGYGYEHHDHGHHSRDHGHHGHGHGCHHEHAFERGFEAGFARGRESIRDDAPTAAAPAGSAEATADSES
jgi:Transcriptional regulators